MRAKPYSVNHSGCGDKDVAQVAANPAAFERAFARLEKHLHRGLSKKRFKTRQNPSNAGLAAENALKLDKCEVWEGFCGPQMRFYPAQSRFFAI